MGSERWIKKAEPARNISQSDVRRMQLEKERQRLEVVPEPVSEPVDQLTTLDDQLTTVANQLTNSTPISVPVPLVNQSTSQLVSDPNERFYPSRTRRTLKGIRFQTHKLEAYEEWHFKNRKTFPSFQDAVEYAMDWLTSQPVSQLTGQPVNQSTTLIINDLDQLIINDARAEKILGRYSELSGRRVTTNDIEAFKELSHLDEAVILRGLALAAERAKKAGKSVNSFRYARNPILEVAASSPPMTQNSAQSDFSACPDCNGTGFWYPNGTEKGVTRCTHVRLKGSAPTSEG